MTNGQIAQIAYGANKSYCESLADYSQPAWEELPLEKKEGFVNAVKLVLKNPKVTPEELHDQWVALMEKRGWKYMEKEDVTQDEKGKKKIVKTALPKNEVRKIHPFMVPFGDLPEVQQYKNVLYLATVRACADKASPKEEKPVEKPVEKAAEPKKEAPVANKGSNVHKVQKKLRKK